MMLYKTFTNPYLKNISESEKEGGENSSYYGIAFKTILFFILMLAGTGCYLYNPYQELNLYFLLGASISYILTLIIAWIFKRSIPVIGMIYSLSQGILLGALFENTYSMYEGIIPIALGICLFIFLIILGLYSFGIIKPSQRFKAFTSTVFLILIIGSSVYFFLNQFYGFDLSGILNVENGTIALVVSSVVLLFAIFSLIADFDNISIAVKKGLPKRYEWYASFGLFVSIMWIFLKVLQILSIFYKKND